MKEIAYSGLMCTEQNRITRGNACNDLHLDFSVRRKEEEEEERIHLIPGKLS